MYARVTRLQAPTERIAELVEAFKSTAVPAFRALPGYAGSSLAIDTATGDGQGVTFWESREAVEGSRQDATAIRTDTATMAGTTVTAVDEYEQLLFERAAPPQLPSFLRATRCRVDVAQLDALAAALRNEALPAVQALDGFRALILGANRETGTGVVTSVWDSAEHREASDVAIDELRNRIFDSNGVSDREVARYQVFAVEFVGVGAAAG